MKTNEDIPQSAQSEIDIHFGNHEIVIRTRYEFFYNLNDILIGIWFLIGSILFFWTTTKDAGIWLFVLGSAQLLIRPLIRIIRKVHLKKVSSSTPEKS